MAWSGKVVGEENRMIGPQDLRAKKGHHALEKIEARSSFWTKPALEPNRWGQPAPRRTLTRKKERKKSENWKPDKDKYSTNRFPSTIWSIEKLYVLKKREKLWRFCFVNS